MDEQVMQPRRRDVVAKRLERHASVARRELQLLGGQRSVGRLQDRGACHGAVYAGGQAADKTLPTSAWASSRSRPRWSSPRKLSA